VKWWWWEAAKLGRDGGREMVGVCGGVAAATVDGGDGGDEEQRWLVRCVRWGWRGRSMFWMARMRGDDDNVMRSWTVRDGDEVRSLTVGGEVVLSDDGDNVVEGGGGMVVRRWW
ncbi:hypothetical protein Tco_0683712, partial [Tanacetum coccineum]